MSLPGELRGDSSWKNERFSWIYLLYIGFLLPRLKIYFPRLLGDLCIISVLCIQRICIPALTELMPFAFNGNLNYSWSPPPPFLLVGFFTKPFLYFAEGSFESLPKISKLLALSEEGLLISFPRYLS